MYRLSKNIKTEFPGQIFQELLQIETLTFSWDTFFLVKSHIKPDGKCFPNQSKTFDRHFRRKSDEILEILEKFLLV